MFDFELLTPYIEIIFPMSLIIAIMLLMVPVMNKRYVAKARYFIWLVIAIRLLLPFDINVSKEPVHLFTAPISDFTIIREDVVDYIRQENVDGTVSQMEFFKNKDVTDKTDDSQASSVEKVEKPMFANFPIISLHTIIEWVWSLGTVGLFMYYILQYFIAKVHIRKFSRKDSYAQITLNSLCKKMNIKRKLKIYRCNCVNSAMIMGVLSPAIFIPDTETSDEMLEMILYHELTHYKRKDILYKFVLMLACCVHWFNPLVWLMDRQAQKDVEICCDDDVIKGHSEEFKRKYSESILKMVKFGVMRKTAFSTGFAMDKKTLASRFRNIFDSRIKHSGKAVLATVLALCIMSTTLISCAPKQEEKFDIPQQAMDFMQFYCNYRDNDNLIEKDGYDLGFAYLHSHNLLKEDYIHSYYHNGNVESYRLPMSAMMDVYQFIVSYQMPSDWWEDIPELHAMSWASDYNCINPPYELEILSAEKTGENIANITLSRTREGVPCDNIMFILEQQTVEYVPDDLTAIFEVGQDIWRIKEVDILEGSWQPADEKIIEISTVDDYLAFVEDYNINGFNRINYTYKLMNDIDFNGMELTPVSGTSTAPRFAAQFDGQGHTLSNFKITYDMYTGNSDSRKIGLFSDLSCDKNAKHVAEIRNLNIKDAYVAPIEDEKECTISSVGILCGGVNGGYISHCNVSGYVEGRLNTGGLVGYRSNGFIDNCTTDVQVNGNAEIGCFAGTLHMSRTTDCESRGTVTGYSCNHSENFYYNTPYRVGGFAGTIHSSVIDSCYANASLKIMNTAKNVGAFSATGEMSDFINCRYNADKAGNWDIVDYFYSPAAAHTAQYIMNPA